MTADDQPSTCSGPCVSGSATTSAPSAVGASGCCWRCSPPPPAATSATTAWSTSSGATTRPPAATNALQVAVSRLRRVARRRRRGAPRRRRLHPRRRRGRRRHRRRARRAAGRPGAGGRSLDATAGALGLWRGEPYAGLGDAPTLAAEATRLEEARLILVEARAAGAAGPRPARGGAPPAGARWSATHPFRERLWSLLALALYRSDRQADALETLRTAARRPWSRSSASTRPPRCATLEEQMLAQDPALDGPRPPTPTRPPTGRPAPTPTDPRPGLRRRRPGGAPGSRSTPRSPTSSTTGAAACC